MDADEIASTIGVDDLVFRRILIVVVEPVAGDDVALFSVGDFDVVKKVLAGEGEITFWRVRMKPGKPLAFGHISAEVNGQRRTVPLLGMPGNWLMVVAVAVYVLLPQLADLPRMIEAIRAASIEELMAVSGINREIAENIKSVLGGG